MSTKESDDAEVKLGSRFHRLFGATLVSAVGTGMHAAASPLLALQSTSSPMALSFVVMAAEIPWVLLSLHAGVVVDRTDRRRVMVWADLGRFAVLAREAGDRGAPVHPDPSSATRSALTRRMTSR